MDPFVQLIAAAFKHGQGLRRNLRFVYAALPRVNGCEKKITTCTSFCSSAAAIDCTPLAKLSYHSWMKLFGSH